MVHLGFSNQNLSKSPLGMACLNYSSENSPVTKLRFGKYRRGWIEKMRLVRRSKQTERVTTFLLPLLSMSQVEPTMPSFSKIISPFYRILRFSGDNWVGVWYNPLWSFSCSFNIEEMKVSCVWWCPCVNYPIRKRALKATPLELSNLELSRIILNYPIRKRARLWKQHLLSWVGRLAPEWLDFQHTQPAANSKSEPTKNMKIDLSTMAIWYSQCAS